MPTDVNSFNRPRTPPRGSQATAVGGAGYVNHNMGQGPGSFGPFEGISSGDFWSPINLSMASSMFPGVMGQVAPYASHLLGGSNVMGSQAGPTNSDMGYGASIYNALAGGLSQRTGIAAEHAGVSPGYNPSGMRAPGGFAIGTPGNIGGNHMIPAGGAIPQSYFDGSSTPSASGGGSPAAAPQPAASVTPKVYKRPGQMKIPGGYDYLKQTMHPFQQRLATAAFNGPFDYWANLLGQELIDERGNVRVGTEIMPSEWDFARKRGLNVQNNDLTGLADLLYT